MAQTAGVDSEWVSEEHWMVSGIVDDLAGMARLAKSAAAVGKVAAGEESHSFSVGGKSLPMKPSCWDTASYVSLVRSWEPASSVAPEPALDIVETLLTPTAKELQRANDLVSGRHKAHPGSHTAHEEAAFMLGVLGIRENARDFSDIRPLIGRMTAHLAMAEVLRGGRDISLAGKWAEVFHSLHMGRPIAARKVMEGIPGEGDSISWKRAVEMLVTGDWRRASDVKDPALVEQIAHARALQVHRSNADVIEFSIANPALSDTPEPTRLLLRGGASVEEGHMAMAAGPGMEFAEIAEIFRIGAEPDERSIGRHLVADAPSRLVAGKGIPRVISDADWAAYFRRHLYACFERIGYFTMRQWASYDDAVSWEHTVDPYCRNLPDYELVRPLFLTTESDYEKALEDTREYIQKHPERVPVALWFNYRFSRFGDASSVVMPDQRNWIRTVSPPETAHDPLRRVRFEGVHGSEWLPTVKALHAMDPWNHMLCYEIAENTGNNSESVSRGWGELLEYSVRPLKQTLEDPSISLADRIDTLEKYSAIDANLALDLAEALLFDSRPEEAIKAYDLAYEKATDRVGFANSSAWMIHYHNTHGEKAKAREIADHNAAVYSAGGLLSAMALALDEKDFSTALTHAENLHDRYGDPCGLAAVALVSGKTDRAFKHVFPDGSRKVTAGDFSAKARVSGTRLIDNSLTMTASGLKSGDIILAVDGIRTESYQQYITVLNSTLDPVTNFIFKRAGNVMELECVLPDRRLDTGTAPAER